MTKKSDSLRDNPRIHECQNQPGAGVYIYFGEGAVHDRPATWYVYLVREATEEDLGESHILEEVGEPIWSVAMEVMYCPYCGEALRVPDGADHAPAKSMEVDAGFGAFTMFDQEKWNGRIR